MLRHSTGYKLANDGHDTRSLDVDGGARAIAAVIGQPKLRQCQVCVRSSIARIQRSRGPEKPLRR